MITRFKYLILSLVFVLILTSCLPSRILPEQNDWSSIYIENTNRSKRPRVLFVGDSITYAYYPIISERLKNQYYTGRYTTSKFINHPDFHQELRIILKRYDFEIIQVNQGLHGWDYPPEEYQKGLNNLVRLLDRYAPEAEIIWCLTTPVRQRDSRDQFRDLNQQVLERNQLTQKIIGQTDYQIVDMYSAMLDHPEYYKDDGMHFNNQGREAQAEIILSVIQDLP